MSSPSVHVDIVVLGGGIIGCATAWELARRGQSVAVVERGAIGAEASKAAAGILSAQMDLERPGPFFELCQASRRMYGGWVRELERASRASVGYHVDGILYLARTKDEAERMGRRSRWQRKRGLRVERWSPHEVRRREPNVDGSIAAGFFFPTEAQVDNVALMEALAVACRKAGVTLMDGTTAVRVLTRRRRVVGVQTSRSIYRAPVVVNCLGSWAPLMGVLPRPSIAPARGQMLAFDAPKGLFRHVVMTERAYGVQRKSGRLIVGSTVEFAGFEKTLTLEGIHGILCGLRQISSAVNACQFLEAWAGFRPYTPDQLPILGRTSIEGLYVATGHFRHGILLAPITAEVMAELTLRGKSGFDLGPFDPSRFGRQRQNS
jgi:glycine oxidase